MTTLDQSQNLFDLLEIDPKKVKLHFATQSKKSETHQEHPIYFNKEGEFDEWQALQTRRNFQRDLIVSLIQLNDKKDEWLFVGVYKSCKDPQYKFIDSIGTDNCILIKGYRHVYKTERTKIGEEFIERIVVKYKKPFRNSYPCGETVESDLKIYEIRKR